MFQTDPNVSVETLLENVKNGAMTGFNGNNPNAAITPFATLLVRLARDADKTANKVVRLTWALIVLTVALLIFTAVLVDKESA